VRPPASPARYPPRHQRIVVSAGASDSINLRGLIFDGVNASGTSGVVFLSGARLHIENCVFLGFTASGMTFSQAPAAPSRLNWSFWTPRSSTTRPAC